uniref:Uncharacterized protein n=1 Tax=Anguilla anguilla TaxID=7936 RepID=A0A0E9TU17_ANGAN
MRLHAIRIQNSTAIQTKLVSQHDIAIQKHTFAITF